jgi:MFS transporter, DHA1 family, multidrug resistance protein
VIAPMLGGAILAAASWRTIFFGLAVIGVLLVVAVVAWVPESLPAERRQRGEILNTFRALGKLAGRRDVMGYVLTAACCSAALFVYIAGSTFVFQDALGVSTTGYSLIFAINALGMLVTSAVFGALAGRVRVNTLLTGGVVVAVLGAVTLAVVLLAGAGGVAVTWIFLALMLAGIGLVNPASATVGQVLGRDSAGAASALMGGFQFLLGAGASPLVGAIGTGSPLPMAIILLCATGLALLSLVFLARPWQRRGEP